jgi:hypothetical protein
MKTTRYYLLLPVAAWLLVAAPVSRAAGESEPSTIKFTDPAKPGTLRVVIAMGDVKVTGADVAEVIVATDIAPATTKPRADGLRILSESATFSLTEKDNVVTLDAGQDLNFRGGQSRFDITVPRHTCLMVSNALGGEIRVSQLTGDIEIKSLNGEVKLTDVAGGALVETMNGGITARILTLHEGKPLSFTSMNGEITLHVPADANANVRLRTQNGAILTDFDEKTLVTKTESLPGSHKSGRVTLNFGHGAHGESTAEIRETVREAVRVGVEAAREAAYALRETAQAAREAAQAEAAHAEEARETAYAAREAAKEARAGDGSAPRAPRAPQVSWTPKTPRVPLPPPVPPMTGGKLVSGTLNAGGTEISASAMNGDVTFRKAK